MMRGWLSSDDWKFNQNERSMVEMKTSRRKRSYQHRVKSTQQKEVERPEVASPRKYSE
jgi:hypothetical protein